MNKRTIYYYGIDNNYGGMETYAYNLIKGVLAKDNSFNFHIISIYKDYAYREELEKLGVSSSIVPNKKKHPIKYIRSIRKILSNSDKNDFLQLNVMSYRNILLFHAVKKSKIKVLIVGHATGVSDKGFKWLHNWSKHHYRNLGFKIGVSNDVISYMFDKSCKCDVIHNAIDSKKFQFNLDYRKEIRDKYNIKNDTFVIGNIGRISVLKNQLFMSYVLELLLDKQNIQLYLFGKEQDSSVREYIEQNNLTNIHLMGEVKETYKLYSAFDMFIFPSNKGEAAGIAFYEALANGLKCIVSPNVPSIDIKDKSNIKVLELNTILWAREILDNIDNNYPRINYIKDSQYELNVQIDKYIERYKNI